MMQHAYQFLAGLAELMVIAGALAVMFLAVAKAL